MKLSELKLFKHVVDAGSMSLAANALDLSQPNVSRTIRGLESRLKTTLLKRTGRGVEPTPSGQRFLSFAENVIADFERTQADIHELDGTIPTRLSVCIPRHTGRLLVPAIFRVFHEQLPEVTLEISERQAHDASKAMALRGCDVAVFYDNSASPFPERRRLFTEPLYVTGHRKHLGDHSNPVTLKECAGLPLLMYSNPPYAKMIETAFAAEDLHPKIIRHLGNKVAMTAFAMEGEGVAIQAFSNFANEYENGEIQARLIVGPGIERNILAALGLHLERRFAERVFKLLKSALKNIAPAARWRR
jgi:LysR family transcriptional regulator, nitrogen assimilation regulatory protein